ncbi:MAG: B12 lower ligand biosynthesis ThiC-like protein BzaB [Desulfitobacteriaceae bacterium]
MTQLIKARNGEITESMRIVAAQEGVSPEYIREMVALGQIVILGNKTRKNVKPCGVGKGLSTKVNANIGNSPDCGGLEDELIKLRTAEKAGAHAFMELSSGANLDEFRRQALASTELPVGTVTIYQAGVESIEKYGSVVEMDVEYMFELIERHAADGVDFMAVHAALNFDVIERLKRQGRVTDIVSRGGSFLTGWMLHNNKENPYYEQFDRILEIAKKYDVVLSIGDAIRPGCLADSMDRAQMQGLILVGELVQRALEAGVQVMVEGPGHVPSDQIPATVQIQKQLCHKVPYYMLGNLVTDIAPGYDHITAAIGAHIAAASGADFICYVTPAEHLRLPNAEDVHEGVIATRLACHAADIVKKVPGAWEWDLKMAKARKALDWKQQIALAIDPERAATIRAERNAEDSEACSMCGGYCAMKIISQYLNTSATCC